MQQNGKTKQNNRAKSPVQQVYKPKSSPPATTTTINPNSTKSLNNDSIVVPGPIQEQDSTVKPTENGAKPKRVRNRKQKTDKAVNTESSFTATDNATQTDTTTQNSNEIEQPSTAQPDNTTETEINVNQTSQTLSDEPITLKYNLVHKPNEIQITFKAPLIQQRNDIAVSTTSNRVTIDFNTRPKHFAYNPLNIDLSQVMQQYSITDISKLKYKVKYFNDSKKFILTYNTKSNNQSNTTNITTQSTESTSIEPQEEGYVIEVSDTVLNHNTNSIDHNNENDRLSPVLNEKENDQPVDNNINNDVNSVIEPNDIPTHRDSIDSNGNIVKSILRTRSISTHSNTDRKIKFNIDEQLYELDEIDVDVNENSVDNDITTEKHIQHHDAVQPEQIQKIDKSSPKTDTRGIIKQKQPTKPKSEIDELANWIEKGVGKKPKKLQTPTESQQQSATDKSSKTRQKQKISEFKANKLKQQEQTI